MKSQLVSVRSLTYQILFHLYCSGVCYQLPLIMWAITAFKMVEPDFERNNLKNVIIILIVLAALSCILKES